MTAFILFSYFLFLAFQIQTSFLALTFNEIKILFLLWYLVAFQWYIQKFIVKAVAREKQNKQKKFLSFETYSQSNLPDNAKRYIIIECLPLLYSSPNLVQEYACRKSCI